MIELLLGLTERLRLLEMRLDRLLRWGKVDSVDKDAATVKVKLPSGLVIGPMRWAALSTAIWAPPTVGEQCLVVCPSGDDAQAAAVCGFGSGPGNGDEYRVGLNAAMKVALAELCDQEHQLIAAALTSVSSGGSALTGPNTYTAPSSVAAQKTKAE